MFKNGTIRDLGSLGGPTSAAFGVNAIGQIVGYAQKANGDNHAFIHNGGLRVRDIGTLGGAQSFAFDINDLGQVVGFSDTAGGSNHVFVWQQGEMTDLGIPTPGGSIANNNLGQIVGPMTLASGSKPALYSDGTATDLNDLLPVGSGWVITQVSDINDSGQIVGFGSKDSYDMRAFLMSPDRTAPVPPQTPRATEVGLVTSTFAMAVGRDLSRSFTNPRMPWARTPIHACDSEAEIASALPSATGLVGTEHRHRDAEESRELFHSSPRQAPLDGDNLGDAWLDNPRGVAILP